MSGALSIFQKVCPSCAAHISVEAANCTCGHEFEGAGSGNVSSAEEQALRDEELYENYLAARAGQAAEAARAAADWLAEEPDNGDRANAAQLAREVATSLEVDLNEQRAKINAMRRALGPRLMSTPPAKPVAATAPPPSRPMAAMPAPAKVPAAAAKPRISTPPAAPTPAPVAAKPAPTVPAPTHSPAPAARVTPVLPSLSSASKAAAALDAIKRAKAQEATPEPTPTVSTTPPDSFRAEQAARASRAVAEQPKTATGKDCPNCTASVPLATTRCRCGYTFVSGTNNLPTLTLCTGDFTALRNSLNLNSRK